MGDNVYGDDRITGKLDKLSKAYKKQKTKIPFTKLEETNEVYAIWDDHDYGPNNIGRNYWLKEQATEVFQLMWGNPSAGHPEIPGIFT